MSLSTAACPEIPENGCSVCGPGMCVTDFGSIFAFPGQPSVRCGDLEKAGLNGIIPLDQCGFLPSLVMDKCKCQNESLRPTSPTGAPTQMVPTYPAPTQQVPTYSVPTQLVPVYSIPAPSNLPPSPTNVSSLRPPHLPPTSTTLPNNTCPDVPKNGCSVCGPGMCVTDFDAIFDFPGQPSVKCGDLERAGLSGIVPLDQCGFLPGLVLNRCKCQNESLHPNFQTRPKRTPTPTSAPLPNNKCPSVPEDGCSVCGPGMCVTDFDAILEFPGQPALRCGDLEKAGLKGVVPLDQCGFLPGLIMDECICRAESSGSPSPTGAPRQPTRAPTRPSSYTPSPNSASWARITYPPFEPFGGSYSNPSTAQSEGTSDGLIIGLTIGFSLVGMIISLLAVFLLRRRSKVFKDASIVGVTLEADGSSIMKNKREIESKVTQDLADDPDL